MKTRACVYTVFFAFLFLGACSVPQKADIESIHVLFYNYSFQPFLPVRCDEIIKDTPSWDSSVVTNEHGDSIGVLKNNHGVLDTIIINPFVLKDIAHELRNIKADSVKHPIDARISCIIKYRNNREEHMCIGGYYAEAIEYNGIRQKQNNKLLYLIKKHIGYYSWMEDRILEYSEELHDNSFKRDSVVGYHGRKF